MQKTFNLPNKNKLTIMAGSNGVPDEIKTGPDMPPQTIGGVLGRTRDVLRSMFESDDMPSGRQHQEELRDIYADIRAIEEKMD